MFPVNLWLLTRVLFVAHAAVGALGTRSSLRPLIFFWGQDHASPGRIAPRECGRVFSVIARSEATKQSIRSFFMRCDGLLRFARNDGAETESPHRRPGQASDSERRSGTHTAESID